MRFNRFRRWLAKPFVDEENLRCSKMSVQLGIVHQEEIQRIARTQWELGFAAGNQAGAQHCMQELEAFLVAEGRMEAGLTESDLTRMKRFYLQ